MMMHKSLLARRTNSATMSTSTTTSGPSASRSSSFKVLRVSSGRRHEHDMNVDDDRHSCPNSPAVKKCTRLVVVGSTQTGKTSIVNRFLEASFSERYVPTIENFHRKMYKIRGDLYQLDIIDTSGNDPFPAARRLCFISGDLFLLVSSVDLPASFERLFEYYEQIIDCKKCDPANIPIALVLNKCELTRRQVDVETCQRRIADTYGNHGRHLIVSSAKTGTNIDTIFSELFTSARLPKQMCPEMHKLLRNEWSADGQLQPSHRSSPLQRMRSRFSSKDIVDNPVPTILPAPETTVRRTSLRTDLLLTRVKAMRTGDKEDTAINRHGRRKQRCILS